MQTLFDPDARAGLHRRLEALQPTTPPRWGRMSAPAMLCHLIDAVESSEGPSPSVPARGALTWTPLKQLVIYLLPWPKGRLESPSELLITTPSSWEADVARLRTAIDRVAQRDPAGSWPASDVFGALTGREWGALLWTHINHHFRQFGV